MDLIITILPVVTKDLPISPLFTPYDFLSRCKFSTLTTPQPITMVEFCKARTKTLHGIQSGSSMAVTLGQHFSVREKPTDIIVYTYTYRHAGTQNKNKRHDDVRLKLNLLH